MFPIDNSSDAKKKKLIQLIDRQKIMMVWYLLGCNDGTCCASLSSFNMCKRVVLPALSNPKNNNLPDFFHNPKNK